MATRRRRRRGDGSVFPRKDGRWVAQVAYRGPDGRRKFLTRVVRSEDLAKHAVQGLLTKVGADRDTFDARRPLDAYLEEWLGRVEVTVRPATYRSYRGHVEHHISPLLGGIPLDDLRTVDVDRLVRDRTRAGLSGATVRRILTTLGMAIKTAVDDGTIDRNVVAQVKRPKAPRHEITALTPERAKRILEAIAGDPNAALYELLLGSGMRAGEAIALDWRDVDLDNGTVFIRTGKTPRAVRTIPIPPSVVASLRAHRARASTIDPRAPVFVGERKGQRLRTDVALHRFQQLLRAAKIPSMRIHDLRHGHATLLLAAGVPMQVIADQLGHSNPATTAMVYAHVQPGALRKAVNSLDEWIRRD